MDIVYFFSCAFVLLFAAMGYYAGFIKTMLAVFLFAASAICSVFIIYLLGHSQEVLSSLSNTETRQMVFVFIFLLIFCFIFLLVRMINRLFHRLHATIINKAAGILPGAGLGIMIVTLLLNHNESQQTSFLSAFTSSSVVKEVGKPVYAWVENCCTNFFQSDTTTDSEKPGALSFSTNEFTERQDLEIKMLIYVNEERKLHGLKTLQYDAALTAVARKHSADMFQRGYFSHITPEGYSPFDRMRFAGIKYKSAAENLALSQTLLRAHEGLMKSKGHRENLLFPGFSRVGIGILDGGEYGLMISQEFRD